MMNLCNEKYPAVMAAVPQLGNALTDGSDWIKLTNTNGCLITILYYDGGATSPVFTVHEGATGAGTTALAVAWPIWINLDVATSDTMVRQTDAITYTLTCSASALSMIIQFYIPASILTDGYEWIQLGATAGNAASYVAAMYQLDGARYQQTTPPTATV
jgi:hypothetical protein